MTSLLWEVLISCYEVNVVKENEKFQAASKMDRIYV